MSARRSYGKYRRGDKTKEDIERIIAFREFVREYVDDEWTWTPSAGRPVSSVSKFDLRCAEWRRRHKRASIPERVWHKLKNGIKQV